MLFYTEICPSMFCLVHVLRNLLRALHFIKWPWINLGFFLVFFLTCNTCIASPFFKRHFQILLKRLGGAFFPDSSCNQWRSESDNWGQTARNNLFCRGVEFASSSDSGHRMDASLFTATSVVTAPSLAWCTCSLGTSLSPKMEITQSVQKFHKVQ